MATAQNEKMFMDSENYGQSQRTLPNKQQFHSDRKHTIRKHALGEIKNVIHNQSSITPFKGLQSGSSKSLSKDLLKKQTDHQKQSQKVQPIVTNKGEEFEKRDLPAPRTCNEKCSKSLEEIWSGMNVLEPELLERLVNGDGDEEDYHDLSRSNLTPIDFDDSFDLTFDIPDPYELEDKKLLENFLAKDYECDEFPLAADWIDDL